MNYIDLLKAVPINFQVLYAWDLILLLKIFLKQRELRVKGFLYFMKKFLNKLVQKKIFPGAVKPNYAFYAQYGIDGISSLEKIIKIYQV